MIIFLIKRFCLYKCQSILTSQQKGRETAKGKHQMCQKKKKRQLCSDSTEAAPLFGLYLHCMLGSNKCWIWLTTKRAHVSYVNTFSGTLWPGFGPKLCLQLPTWIRLLIGTHNDKVPLNIPSDKRGQHKYRLCVFIYLFKKKMAEWEELGRFLVGLIGEITHKVARGLQM